MRRRLARELAVQSLYQLRMNEVDVDHAIRMVIEEALQENEAELRQKNEDIVPSDVKELVAGTEEHLAAIDNLLTDYLKGWSMDRLSKVDREILRMGVYEMVFREDVPPKVVVNEAIEMSKNFGTEESGKFVNGVLGKMITELEGIKEKL
ncbi:transcription antitermination factor NusB [Paenibacillus mesotrionivorans]|uniref:Transcription antitermination factor NusB n=1 Tax=Paenibacillus mesotrionivorans TaxID=3160968 RepID=A0ACC7P1L9_9BACL